MTRGCSQVCNFLFTSTSKLSVLSLASEFISFSRFTQASNKVTTALHVRTTSLNTAVSITDRVILEEGLVLYVYLLTPHSNTTGCK